jgi:hypothetical protein
LIAHEQLLGAGTKFCTTLKGTAGLRLPATVGTVLEPISSAWRIGSGWIGTGTKWISPRAVRAVCDERTSFLTFHFPKKLTGKNTSPQFDCSTYASSHPFDVASLCVEFVSRRIRFDLVPMSHRNRSDATVSGWHP